MTRVLVHPLFFFFTPPPFSFPLSPRSPSTTRTTPLSPPSSFRPPFSSFLSRHPSPKPSTTSFMHFLPIPLHLFLLFPPIFLPSPFYSNWDAASCTSSCTSNQKPFMEKLLWGKGFSASVETNSNFRVRFFYFGSVPMNFCEPGFGSIPVGEVSIKFTGINVIPRVSKDRPPWVLGD